jgi:hypothetical protein
MESPEFGDMVGHDCALCMPIILHMESSSICNFALSDCAFICSCPFRKTSKSPFYALAYFETTDLSFF